MLAVLAVIYSAVGRAVLSSSRFSASRPGAKLVALGWLRAIEGLSFRGMDDIYLHIVGLGAAEGQSPHDERPREPRVEALAV